MATFTLSNPDGVRRAATSYSHAAWIPAGHPRLVISGQVGLRADGSLAQGGAGQIEQAFANLGAILAAHGLGFADIAKSTVFLTDRDLIGEYRSIRARMFGDHAPASTLLIVAGLADPAWLVEIEAEAVAGGSVA